MTDQVFISFATEDGILAEALHDAMQDAGIQCWIAHHDIKPGESWGKEIRDAIRESAAFLLLLSEHSNKSQYVLREVTAAVDQQIPILTVRIQDIKPSDDLEFFLSTTQWLNAFAYEATRRHKLVIDVVLRLLQPESTAAGVAGVAAEIPPARTKRIQYKGLQLFAQKHRKAVIASTGLLGVALLGSLGMNALPWWRSRNTERVTPSLTISEPAGQYFVGETFYLQAKLTGDSTPIQWLSSDSTIVKIAPADSQLHAVGAGSALIFATAGARADTVKVTISTPAVASLIIDSVPAFLNVGDSVPLKAIVKDSAGRILVVKPAWSSQTPRILSVDAERGFALAMRAGSGKVIARAGSASQVIDITVRTPVSPSRPGNTLQTRPQLQIDPGLVRGLTNTPSESTTSRTASTVTESRMKQLAADCISAMRKPDFAWLSSHYNPTNSTDHANLRSLEDKLKQQSYRVTREEVDTPNLAEAAIEFRVYITYRRFTGGGASELAPFRVTAARSAAGWNLASCRMTGPFVRG